MRKINVIGTSASGKSTFSKQLAKILNYPYIEMDALFWGKDWTPTPDKTFFDDLAQILKAGQWVLDGNYTRTNSIKWKEVDTIIWLDYSLGRIVYQSVKRAIYRSVTREELWPGTGNRESFSKLFSRNSIVLWAVTNHRKNRSRNRIIKQYLSSDDIDFIHLRNPQQAKVFLEEVNVEAEL